MCQDSSVVKCLPIDPMANGSNLPVTKLSLMCGESVALCKSKDMNQLRGVPASRGGTWIIFDKQTASQCPKSTFVSRWKS